MGIYHQKPFDADGWHKKYFSIMNELLYLYKTNPQLNISDVYVLVQVLDSVVSMIDERYKLHKKIEQLTANNCGVVE